MVAQEVASEVAEVVEVADTAAATTKPEAIHTADRVRVGSRRTPKRAGLFVCF